MKIFVYWCAGRSASACAIIAQIKKNGKGRVHVVRLYRKMRLKFHIRDHLQQVKSTAPVHAWKKGNGGLRDLCMCESFVLVFS